MTKGKLYEKIKESFWKEFNESGERWFDYLGPHEENAETTKLIWKDMGIEKVLDEAKKEFEGIMTLLYAPPMPNMDRKFQTLLCLNEWKIKWFGSNDE